MGSTRTTASLFVAVLALAGCGGGSSNDSDGAPAHASIAISGFKFKPAVITVRAGARITFVNRDHADHTATGESFDTGTLHSGDSKSVELRRPGTVAYRCDFHPFMTAQVTVVK